MATIQIRNTSNVLVTGIEAGKIDSTSTSINLFGQGTESYLKEINENFYKLLENFASKKSPLKPQIGQIWYAKKGSNTVEVRGTGLNHTGNRYVKINGVDKSIASRRGIALMIIDNDFKNSIKFIGYYDTYGSDAATTQLARKLATVEKSQMFILSSYDAIGTNNELNTRMEKLGSQAWHKIKKNWRYPYAAIGTGQFGIISEDLRGFDEKKFAMAHVAFESLIPEEGMGAHTSLMSANAKNDNLLVWNGTSWSLSAETIDGKDLKTLRSYVLSGIDLSVKFDKTGGTVNGSVLLSNTLIPQTNIIPTGNEIQDLGSATNRYSSLYLSTEQSIYMGPGKEFNKNSFVYTVEKETDSIASVPAGSLILNRATGEAVVKKADFKASTNNNTFRKLTQDKNYGAVIGGNNYNFKGDKGIWMGSWNHGKIQRISIPTPSNSTDFGTCRTGGHSAGASDGTRGLSFHQLGNSSDQIQYITIATPMNAIDFGNANVGHSSAAASDGDKAVSFGGSTQQNASYYVIFATPMSSIKFGDLNTSAHWNAAVSDGQKAIFDRGAHGGTNNQYSYVHMSTPSNGIYFGRMQNSRGYTGASSNGINGLWAGGNNGTNVNSIEKLTLATPGNSTHFGSLTYSRHTPSPVSNDSTMVAAGGDSYSTTLDYISYANGGSASQFGNAGTGIRYAANFSGN